MIDSKDMSQESFLLVRFESPNSTKIIDTKMNNIDEMQMVGIAQLLELIARNSMLAGINIAKSATVEPPKLYKP